MALVPHNIEDCKVGIFKSGTPSVAQQAAWGTAEADTVDALELDLDSIVVNEDVQLRDGDAALSGVRTDDVYNHYRDSDNAAPNFEVASPHGVLKDELAIMLYGFFQKVVQEATTPFKKTFTFHATQPDFTVHAGYFATFCFKAPDASHSILIGDCIGVEKITFSIEPAGFLQLSQNWMGRGAVNSAANPTGTFTRSTIAADDRFQFNDMTITMDFGSGAEVITLIGGLSIEGTQVATKIGVDSGKFKSVALSGKKGTFKALMLYDANGQSAETNWRIGTAITVNINWGGTPVGDADGDLDFTFKIILNSCQRVPGENGTYAVDIEGTIVGDSANTVEMMTVILTDLQDLGWGV